MLGGKQNFELPRFHLRAIKNPYFSCSSTNEFIHIYRKHVMMDLEPYICVFSNCSQSTEIYSTQAEWISHMKTNHRMGWHCFAFHPDKEPFVAETAEEYKSHMMTGHSERFSEEELSLITNINRQAISPTLERCPFCSNASTASGSLEQHVTKHLQEFALHSLDLPEPVTFRTDETEKTPSGDSSAASEPQNPSMSGNLFDSDAGTRETVKLFRQHWDNLLDFDHKDEPLPVTLDCEYENYTNPPAPDLLDDHIFETSWEVVLKQMTSPTS